MTIKFRTQYDPSLTTLDPSSALYCPPEEGMTSSEFADDCDINKIMARYEKTGQLPQFSQASAQYGDFSQIPDFQTMRDKVIAAEELFMALPAKVRATFHNDPGAFIDSVNSPEGAALLVSLGLATPVDAPLAPSNPVSGAPDKGAPALTQSAPDAPVSKNKSDK